MYIFSLIFIHTIMDFILVLTGLLSVVNPFGIIPVWVTLTSEMESPRRRFLMFKVILNFVLVMLVVLFLGQGIMNFFGLTLPAIRIAGACMIFYSAWELLQGKKRTDLVEEHSNLAFSPLTVPMLAGPGTMGVILTSTQNYGYIWSSYESLYQYMSIMGSVLVCSLVILIVLKSSNILMRKLGVAGIKAMSKVMGFILLSISIQYFINGVIAIVKSNF